MRTLVDMAAGVDFPRSDGERRAWFPDDGACLDYLDWLRWGDGFTCPHCGGARSWPLPDGRRSCAGCARRVSPTAGTVLHRARAPLPVWFAAGWALAGREGGTTARALQRELGLRSYQTAWTMLHRYRRAMGVATDRLSGAVEVGVVRLAGPGAGVVVAVAVERAGATSSRCRLRIVPDGGTATVQAFVRDAVDPTARIGTTRAGSPSPAIDEVTRSVTEWLLGDLHGAVARQHLHAYLDEVAFRFAGRSLQPGARFLRLLQLAVVAAPTRGADLVGHPTARSTSPAPPVGRRLPPARGVTTGVEHPWRRR